MNQEDQGRRHTAGDTVTRLAEPREFERALLLEQRRSERTGQRFALMIVDLGTTRGTLTVPETQKIAMSIMGVLRETDFTGWYKHDSEIGSILTAVNGTHRIKLESVVSEKVRSALSDQLDASQLAAVRLFWQVFPDDETKWTAHSPSAFQQLYGLEDSTEARWPTWKRAMDVFGSLSALLLLAPAFVLISLLVKATSRGPILFRQPRVGRFGVQFTCLKFRSMYAHNEDAIHEDFVRTFIRRQQSHPDAVYKMTNDPRITPLGRFLRKSSLDELPQFFNVLKGEMSLVGPRPPIPYELKHYSLWHRRRIFEAMPGITGQWQVYGRSRTTFDEMVRMDLQYIRNQSFWLDTKLLLKTPLVAISGEGAH